MTTPIETVHTIFKTHLDVGFTDLAGNVVAKYFSEYFPQAIATSESLRRSGREERFIWTTGSWLLYEYLEQASSQDRMRMERAIESGDITWHGLPFTTHSELADASLFKYGLGLSQKLDQRFGKKTIAAKMTDVPGHTRAIVPLLAQAGIRFLHIGVNEGSTMPEVPPVFVWRDGVEDNLVEDNLGGGEVIVMYQHSYGKLAVVPGATEAIAFAHTIDNLGPQTAEQVTQVFRDLRRAFPGAKVIASNLDAYALVLLKMKSQLPVITQEIGDTWIHGVGSDPRKVSQFRELSRLRNRWLEHPERHPDEQDMDSFSRFLLLVVEHTWGMDIKAHLADFENYSRERFDSVRAQDNFKKVATSWAEKRDYISGAVQSLRDSQFAGEARRRLATIEPAIPNKDGFETVEDVSRSFETEHFTIRFDEVSGAIVYLLEKATGQPWATRDHLLGLARYQTFSDQDYRRFFRQFLVDKSEWAVLDYSKPGLEEAGAESKWWQPALSGLFWRRDEQGHHLILELKLPEECTTRYGGPALITLALLQPDREPSLFVELQWFRKPANRQPEAFWFSFCPKVPEAAGWRMEKMGKWISPLEVVRNGNRKLHAVGRGMFYRDDERELAIETLDAPLVAPGEPSLLDFNNRPPPLEKGWHFNLYNNVWGTNFPMWYEEDARFRFILRFGRREQGGTQTSAG